MRKQIDFAPYQEAEVKQILEDGSVLCDLYGGKIDPTENLSEGTAEAVTGGSGQWKWRDTDIVFPAGSQILSLTEQEKIELEEEQIQKMIR